MFIDIIGGSILLVGHCKDNFFKVYRYYSTLRSYIYSRMYVWTGGTITLSKYYNKKLLQIVLLKPFKHLMCNTLD